MHKAPFLTRLAERPFDHDFYLTLRRFECLANEQPRLGRARRPADEAVRLGQEPDLAFAPAPLASCELRDQKPPRLHVRFFGLLGPNGPLPLHITQEVRSRFPHDRTLSRFLDMLQHRFIALLYRAWAQGQPHVNRDRPDDDRFAGYVGATIGLTPVSLRQRDSVPDDAKFFHAGLLGRPVRNADGLVSILASVLRLPVAVEEFVGHWLPLDAREHLRLGDRHAALGQGAALGARVWDRQHKFRIVVGPLTRAQYERLLPGQADLRRLRDVVRLYGSFELEWDVRLELRAADVPPLTLGGGSRLGWTSWLGTRESTDAARDLCLDAEALLAGRGVGIA